ncbi:MAG: hypothetical protein M0Z36_01255 [Thermaerobacter sp.]|nr:hypothetical protein [Thermaerobacter sp.]
MERHLQAGLWQAADRLRLAWALSMHVRDVRAAFDRVLSLISTVRDADERDLVVAAMLALGDRNLSLAQRTTLRRELRRMSKLADDLYQEGREEERKEIALNMLRRAIAPDEIMELTGLTQEQVADLQRQLRQGSGGVPKHVD